MKNLLAIPALAALALAMPASAQSDANRSETRADRGQERLEKMLEGRVAGEPTDCVIYRPNAQLTVIDGTALIYKTGSTIYVNYTANPESLDSDDYLVVRDPHPRLCRTTQITTRDRFGNFFTGAVFLGDFIPYERAPQES